MYSTTSSFEAINAGEHALTVGSCKMFEALSACLRRNYHRGESKARMAVIGENPLTWAENKPGWVTLHADEFETLVVITQSLKHHKIEELEVEVIEGEGKQKFYKIFVDNLGLAYELLNVARVSGW